MEIVVPFDHDIIPEQYAKHSTELVDGNPVVSFPFQLTEVPAEARYFCLALLDWDAIPVCGFPWIHWVAANISADQTEFSADFSRSTVPQVRGLNSLSSKFIDCKDQELMTHYVGPVPPDKDHIYTLYVYALDQPIDVQDGFYLNEMLAKMEDGLVDMATISLIGQC